MNNYLQILNILTNINCNEDQLRQIIFDDDAQEEHELKFAILFRRYYGVYKMTTEEEIINPKEMIIKIVQFKRDERFAKNKYWSIWKENGYFFGFIEGFFHAQEGKNQLCKILGRKIEEDFLLNNLRRKEIQKKFNITDQIDYFKNPDIFVFRFKNLEEFRVFLRINKIQRMVAKKEGTQKGMHFNIYNAVLEISQDESLKAIFQDGILNKKTGELEKQFFESDTFLTTNGLLAILSSFKGYGAKISKMVMNLVFDIKIIAVDRRVLKSSITLNLIDLSNYIQKIKNKFQLHNNNKKEIATKISSISDQSILNEADKMLNIKFSKSLFLSEIDFLLFMYNGGDNWNISQETKKEICEVGNCLLDEFGVCKLRKKIEYQEYKGENSEIEVFRYE
jgi:hypothetical protein